MRTITISAILISLSLTMFLLEGLISLPFLAPGAKLGLSNIVIIVAMYKLKSMTNVLVILIIRIILSAIFVGSPTIIIFSLSGGLLSFIIMILLKQTKKFSLIGVSVAGGFFHNAGQLIAACFIMESATIFNYLSILGVCGIFTGFIVGIIASETIKRIPEINY